MPIKQASQNTTPIYPDRESKNLELKSCLPEFRVLAKTCIALAKSSGGEIIIGVEDGSRNVTGISESERDRLYDEFPSCLYDLASPPLLPHI